MNYTIQFQQAAEKKTWIYTIPATATAVEKKIACVFQFQQKWRRRRKKKLEKSKPVVVEEKDNLHNSIPAPAEKMTKLHDMIPAAMERKIICIIHGLFTILEIQHLLSIPSHAAYHHALSSIHGLVLNWWVYFYSYRCWSLTKIMNFDVK